MTPATDDIGPDDTRRYYRSSSFKMALLFTLLLGLSVAVLAHFGFYFNRDHFLRGTATVLDTEIDYLTLADRQNVLLPVIAQRQTLPDRAYLLLDAKGNRLGGNLPAMPNFLPGTDRQIMGFHPPNSTRTFSAKLTTLPGGRRLLVAMDVGRLANSYRFMEWSAILSIIFMTVVIAISFLISSFVVGHTNRIARTAKDIMHTGDLSRRIAIDTRWDDLSNMAHVLNEFLARFEELMTGFRQVADNIAHDLRTPLTRLRNNLESLKSPNGEDDPAHDILIAEADSILATFNALLRIARIETGRQRKYFTDIDLKRIVRDAIELYEPLAEEKYVRITARLGETTYHGDRDMLFQAFANLVDNAVKFTPPGGTVTLNLSSRDGRPVLTVADTGPGIREEDKDRIFQRFYRAETSRTTEGNGLGLSLVAAVISLHGGTVTTANLNPGAAFTVRL